MKKVMLILIVAISLIFFLEGEKCVAQTITDVDQCLTEIPLGFNRTPILAGNYLWFNSVVRIRSGAPGTSLYFWNQRIHFVVGERSYDLIAPPSEIIFDPSAFEATASYDTTGWHTRVPINFSGNIFLGGLAWLVPSDLPGGIRPVTWSGDMLSNISGLQVNWKWAAAVYEDLDTLYNALGVKPIDGRNLNPYANSDRAGTPELFKSGVIGGATGRGGSNYTGSYSRTSSPPLSDLNGQQCVPITPTEQIVRFGNQSAIEVFADEEKEAGIEIVRDWIVWSEIEPEKDSYDWERMDNKVRKANDAGIEILAYFLDTPNWAKKDPECAATVCAINDMGEFREFARDVARRYDGRHGHGEMKYIEILNEVTLPVFFDLKNTRYENWLIAGYEGVKEGNPEAQVLIGGFVNPLSIKSFVEDMLENYNRYYDIVSFHVYEVDSDVNAASIYMKEKMSLYNVDKPMWITETATVPTQDDPDPHKTIARGVVKRYTAAFGNGVEKVFWWPFGGPPTPEEDPQYGNQEWNKMPGLGWVYPKGSGMPTDEFHPRQAYFTYQLTASKIRGFSSVEKITDTQYKFLVNGKNIYILWSDSEPGLVPGDISGTVKVTDYLGNEEIKNANQIVLTESPVFIEPMSQ